MHIWVFNPHIVFDYIHEVSQQLGKQVVHSIVLRQLLPSWYHFVIIVIQSLYKLALIETEPDTQSQARTEQWVKWIGIDMLLVDQLALLVHFRLVILDSQKV